MRLGLLFVSSSLIAVFAACGSSVSTGSTSTGAGGHTTSGPGVTSGPGTTTTTSTSSMGTGGGGPHGDCMSDSDCFGKPCVPVTPGGYKVCSNAPPEATMCHMQGTPDECCNSGDCKNGGQCFDTQGLPMCGGAFQVYNRCIADSCAGDNDCVKNQAPAICAPPGVFGWPKRECINAYCHTDADCVAAAGGACEPIINPCCGTPYGLACVYPGGCTRDTDCSMTGDQHCQIDAAKGQAVCVPGGVGCPD